MVPALDKKAALIASLLLVLPVVLPAQAAVTADAFFAEMSGAYSKVSDYVASLTITRGGSTQSAILSYKSPVSMNLKFTVPKDEVINFDGQDLIIYDPLDAVVLKQTYTKKSPAQLQGLVSSQGLNLWQRSYAIAWLSGPGAVSLEDGSREMVYKLKLTSRTGTLYSSMVVSVSRDTLLVRRIEGTLGGGDHVTMDFTDIRTNQGLSDTLFAYKEPPEVYMQSDWLFDSEE
jgi:outer membrane lipoprotein-sorting protein